MELTELLVERGKTHGSFAMVADVAVKLQAITEANHETAGMAFGRQMICAKLARIACGDPEHEDHWRDIAGYATLVADEIAKRTKE